MTTRGCRSAPAGFLLALVAPFVLTGPLLAQTGDDDTARGLTASVGVGAGSATLDCAGCEAGETGLAVVGRLGLRALPGLVVAAELAGWRKTFTDPGGEATTTLGFVSLVGQWYPAQGRGGFVKAGLGVSRVRTEAHLVGFGVADAEHTGLGGVVGVGWDVPLAPSLALTPWVDVSLSPAGEPAGNAAAAGDLGGRLLHAGLALTWR